MAADEVEAFEWVRSTDLRDAACVTLVTPADADRIVPGFGGDLADAHQIGLTGIGMPSVSEPVMAIRDLGPWLLVVEVNGWQGSRPEVLRRVSAGGRAVSCYWNESAGTRFSYAVGGRVLTTFDATFPDRRHGADPDCLEEARSGLPWETGEWRVPLMLALLARVTGMRAVPQWLAEDFTVVPVSPVDDDPTTFVYPPIEALTYDDGPLAWALLQADDAARVGVAGIAARYAADQVAGHDPAMGFWAKAAAREASSPNPLAAAFKSVSATYSCLQSLNVPDDELRAEIMSALGNPAPPAGSLGLTAMTGPAPTDRYLWTSAHWLAPVGALRFVREASLDEVARALGADPGSARDGIPSLSRDMVAFRQEGDWLVAVQGPCHPAGTVYRSRPMPADATTVNVIWQARGRSWVHYMTGDTMIDGLDPQRPDMRIGTDPAFLDLYTADLHAPGEPLPFPPEGYPAAQLPVMLAIAERVTGLRFAPQWLDKPHVLMNIVR